MATIPNKLSVVIAANPNKMSAVMATNPNKLSAVMANSPNKLSAVMTNNPNKLSAVIATNNNKLSAVMATYQNTAVSCPCQLNLKLLSSNIFRADSLLSQGNVSKNEERASLLPSLPTSNESQGNATSF